MQSLPDLQDRDNWQRNESNPEHDLTRYYFVNLLSSSAKICVQQWFNQHCSKDLNVCNKHNPAVSFAGTIKMIFGTA